MIQWSICEWLEVYRCDKLFRKKKKSQWFGWYLNLFLGCRHQSRWTLFFNFFFIFRFFPGDGKLILFTRINNKYTIRRCFPIRMQLNYCKIETLEKFVRWTELVHRLFSSHSNRLSSTRFGLAFHFAHSMSGSKKNTLFSYSWIIPV